MIASRPMMEHAGALILQEQPVRSQPHAQPEGAVQPVNLRDVRLIRNMSQWIDVRDSWRKLSTQISTGVTGCPDWCEAWCDHYLGDRQLRVFVLTFDNDTSACLPMFIENIRVGFDRIRIGKLVGSDSVLSYCDPPTASEVAAPVLATAMQHLFGEDNCDAVSLAPLTVHHPLATSVSTAVEALDIPLRIARARQMDVVTTVTLPSSFDEFLAELGRDERKAYRRRLTRLKESGDVSIDVLTGPDELREAFPRFVELHTLQWRAAGKLGHFGDWPGADKFHVDLVQRLSKSDQAWLVRVMAAGKPVAYQYALASGDQTHAVLLARTLDPAFQAYSLGTVAFYTAVEHAIQQGKRTLEVGRGRYEYKLRQGAQESSLMSYLLVRDSLWSRLRARELVWKSELLNKLYYRLWFSRLAPRLPPRRGPLWQSWIRTRI